MSSKINLKVNKEAAQSSGCKHADELISLLLWLQWLDALIGQAIKMIPAVYGAEATQDAFRGLHISPGEAQRLIVREPGASLFATNQADLSSYPGDIPIPEKLNQLIQSFSLSQFDIGILIIALAPELDLKYERLYAYLQDDVSKKRPSVDLVLNLLCSSVLEKLQQRQHFTSDAPLIHHGLVHLITADANQTQLPLLAHTLKLDDQIVSFLLGDPSIDKRIAAACSLAFPIRNLDAQKAVSNDRKGLLALAKTRLEKSDPLWLYFQGPDTTSKVELAEGLASQLGMPILHVNLARLLNATADFKTACRITLREAWLKGAVLYLNEYDSLRESEHAAAHQQFLTQLAQTNGIVILSGITPWIPLEQGPKGILSITFDLPDFSQRLKIWQNTLKVQGIKLSKKEIESLAGRFRLTPNQITDVVITATNQAQLQTFNSSESNQPHTVLDGLFAAARIQTRHILAKLAQHIEPRSHWNDLVLPKTQ